MELFLIDAIGPFFRGYRRKRINWSKIVFTHLDNLQDGDWAAIRNEMRDFARQVVAQGYNAVSLDDLAHLTHHPLHEPEVTARIGGFRHRFTDIFNLLQDEFGLRIYLTSDVLPLTPAIENAIGKDEEALGNYYRELVCRCLDDFPQLSGLILRIGESDGTDVEDPIRTRLHLRDPKGTNRMLKQLLPEFEKRKMELIFRTWTVGAHPIGDLMWHRGTLKRTLEGIDSPHFIVSMKHGESDFFRYLPLNRALIDVPQRKLIEFQARREYEGAGQYPSFIGWDCEQYAKQLKGVDNIAGVSVWCQTGGWHRFVRRAFLEENKRDIWIQLNTASVIAVFKHHEAPERAIERLAGREAVELLKLSDTVIRDLLYIPDFANQKLFFRRVRIPPILHVYWDSLFINHGARKLMRLYVRNHEHALQCGEDAEKLFERMLELARNTELPAEDIEHMRDFCHLLVLARRYFFLPYKDDITAEILTAKKAYKERWPSAKRYRIKTSFEPFRMKRRTLGLVSRIMLRRQRGYRFIDRALLLYLTGLAYRLLNRRDPAKMPKFLRKSAMGVDVLFK